MSVSHEKIYIDLSTFHIFSWDPKTFLQPFFLRVPHILRYLLLFGKWLFPGPQPLTSHFENFGVGTIPIKSTQFTDCKIDIKGLIWFLV